MPVFLQVANGASDLLHTVRMDNDGHVMTRIVRLQVGRNAG
jgi:hypothetical protein